MTQQGYNTNLAAEFHVLSVLHRMGMEAMLTLGNKKSVDIVVVRNGSKVLSLDVKGLAGKSGWPVDNLRIATPDHFLAFVCYAGRIHDPEFAPEVWIVPSVRLDALTYKAPGGRRVVQRGTLRSRGAAYSNAWHLLGGPSPTTR
jgi:hypothetical protein